MVHLETGQMRILAVMSPERLPEPFADIPTAIELGYDAEWTIMRGFYMGKDVSDEDYPAWVDAFHAAYETENSAACRPRRACCRWNWPGRS